MNKYLGKLCPYCKSLFSETDDVVECNICEMPHHKNCWLENGACTTFGCAGKIKDLPGVEEVNTAAAGSVAAGGQAQYQPPQQPYYQPPRQPYYQPPQQPYYQPPQQPYYQPPQTPAFCTVCRSRIVPGDAFCRACGNRITVPTGAPVSREEADSLQYERALGLLEVKNFGEALRIFSALGDYKDSAERVRLCNEEIENARKEEIYQRAAAVLKKQRAGEDELNATIQALSSIPDYKDAQEKLVHLKKMLENWHQAKHAAEETAKKKQYETAASYLSAGFFDEAIRLFSELGEYGDSKVQIESCKEAKETARKEQIYVSAVALLGVKALTDQDLKNAIESLRSISDYKDASERISELEASLEQWYEDQRAAEEAERIRRAARRAKIKKILIIGAIAAVVLAIIICVLVYITTPYSIEYDLNGGVAPYGIVSSYTMLDGDLTLFAPARDGYTFVGWSGTDLDSATVTVTIPSGSTGNRSYKAEWRANEYTLTFDAAGGHVGSASQTVIFDAGASLPVPTRKGYTFLGWYLGDVRYEGETWTVSSNQTLTAKWKANVYTVTLSGIKFKDITVTFDENYSEATKTVVPLQNKEVLPYPEIPLRPGYVFTGWYTDSACTVMYDFQGYLTEDTTLYAGWRKMEQESSYVEQFIDTKFFSGNENAYTVSTEGTSSSEKIHLYVLAQTSGSHKIYFKNSSSSYSYAYYLKIVNLTSGDTIFRNDDISSTYYKSTSFSCNAGDVIVLSLYRYSTYRDYYYSTASFYFEGFDSATSSATASATGFVPGDAEETQSIAVTYDQEFELPVIAKEGYAFLGWYCGEEKLENGVWRKSSDVVAVPKWEAGGNTVTLDANGGTATQAFVAVTYNERFVLPVPTKVGHIFEGWFAGDVKYVSGTWKELEDITLVAKWRAAEYTVTLKDTAYIPSGVRVTFDENYSGASSVEIALADGEILAPPTTPTRRGYVFLGWYTSADCGQRYSFSGNITEDMTLYAGWRESSDFYSVTDSSSSEWSGSVESGSLTSTNKTNYSTSSLRITANEALTVSFDYRTSSELGYDYLYIKKNGTSLATCSGATEAFHVSINLVRGDTLTFTYSKDSSSSAGNDCAYIENLKISVQEAAVSSSATAKRSESLLYTPDATHLITVTYGEAIHLMNPDRDGFYGMFFDGWYEGDTKFDSEVWEIDRDVTLTPVWKI